MAVDDEALCSIEPKTVAGPLGLQFDALRSVLGAFVDSERAEQLALSKRRQMLGLLRLAATARDRRRTQHGRGQEWRWQQRVADLFRNDAGLDVAEAGT